MHSESRRNRLGVSLLLASVCLPMVSANAQDQSPVPQSSRPWSVPALKDIYKKWLEEDVRWIITDQERANFLKLATDRQRDEFVVAFWERRNPIPGSSENKFKEEHYRRLAYANTHFATDVPGWKTDRGREYILYGSQGARRNR